MVMTIVTHHSNKVFVAHLFDRNVIDESGNHRTWTSFFSEVNLLMWLKVNTDVQEMYWFTNLDIQTIGIGMFNDCIKNLNV